MALKTTFLPYVLLVFGLAIQVNAKSNAFWVLGCGKPVVVERLDPIVAPGYISGHVHTVMGGDAFDWKLDYNQTQNSSCTTCVVTKDLSNYWVPTVYFHAENGSFMTVEQVGGVNVYYQERIDHTDIEAGRTVQPFPKGFRMLAGNTMLRSWSDTLEQRAIEFICLLENGEIGLDPFHGFPNRTCDGGLQLRVRFPSCWDSKNLDSDDHQSHVMYPSMGDNGQCPDTHPVRILSIMYEMTWSVKPWNNLRTAGDQPFVLSSGDPTGYGYHGDFVNGWDIDLLAAAINDTSCGDSSGGAIEKCKTFKPFLQSVDGQNSCPPIIPTRITEQIQGTLPSLPGCNPIQGGPQNATVHSCKTSDVPNDEHRSRTVVVSEPAPTWTHGPERV